MSEDRGRRIRHAVAMVLRAIWFVVLVVVALFMLLVIVAHLIVEPLQTLVVFGALALVTTLAFGASLLMAWLER